MKVATRRREVEAAKARKVQSTLDNRSLFRRAGAASDALLQCMRQAAERPKVYAARAAPAAVDAGVPESRQLGACGGVAPAHGGSSGGTGSMRDDEDAPGHRCMQLLAPADVLPSADSGGAGGADAIPAWPGPAGTDAAGAWVAPVDILGAERKVQDIGVRLTHLRALAAERTGVAAAHVQWILQAPYSVGDGATLSFSTAAASAPCCASRHTFSLALQLETCFLMAVVGPCGALRLRRVLFSDHRGYGRIVP